MRLARKGAAVGIVGGQQQPVNEAVGERQSDQRLIEHAVGPEEAPESLAAGYDRKYSEYRSEMRTLGDRHRPNPRPRAFLVIVPERAQWFVLGGSIWGRVAFPAS